MAAVVLERAQVDYEAQAAIELEGIAVDEPWNASEGAYEIELIGGDWTQREPVVDGRAAAMAGIDAGLATRSQQGAHCGAISRRGGGGICAGGSAGTRGHWCCAGGAERRVHA